jgi:hypothetical protein
VRSRLAPGLCSAAIKISIALGVVLSFIAGLIAPLDALAEDGPPVCQFVGVRDAGLLLLCGHRLNGYILVLEDVRRQPFNDMPGRFAFRCVLAPMCAEEPNIGGFFIDPRTWSDSPKDDRTMLDILERHGLVPAAAPGATAGARPPVACAVFDVTVAELPGKATCFDVADGSAVVVIAGDDQVAVVLSFFQRQQTPGAMREKALEMIPRFTMSRPTGDAGLLRWLR